MKTEVKVQRGTRETEFSRVAASYVDISPASGPVQVLIVTGGSPVGEGQ